MKQTAVEWLKGVIDSFGNKHELQMSWSTLDEIIEQAKEMEKEQIMHAYGQGAADEAGEILDATKDSEEYYNKKYVGNK
jgi:hypothetical protein